MTTDQIAAAVEADTPMCECPPEAGRCFCDAAWTGCNSPGYDPELAAQLRHPAGRQVRNTRILGLLDRAETALEAARQEGVPDDELREADEIARDYQTLDWLRSVLDEAGKGGKDNG